MVERSHLLHSDSFTDRHKPFPKVLLQVRTDVKVKLFCFCVKSVIVLSRTNVNKKPKLKTSWSGLLTLLAFPAPMLLPQQNTAKYIELATTDC